MAEGTTTPLLTERFQKALGFAMELHHTQTRKGPGGPNAGHLLIVAGTVLEYGGDEDQAIAALLYDAVEDQGGSRTLADIEAAFGATVAQIVCECTDTLLERGGVLVDVAGTPEEKRWTWKTRKTRYLQNLQFASLAARLVTAAGKLQNLQSLLRDYRLEGEAVWGRFIADKASQLWFYEELARVLSGRADDEPHRLLVEALGDAVGELKLLAQRGTLEQAMAIAARVHAGQTDKAGAAYIHHPLRVMMGVQGESPRIAALLHDVLEDGVGWTPRRLREAGFSEEVVGAVDALSRREGEDYETFVRRAGQHPIAREVKRADLRDNLDVTRLSELNDWDVERVRKYLAALCILSA